MSTFDEVSDDDSVSDAFASVFSDVALESHDVFSGKDVMD